ncbi:DUF4397 domain-containing protein [Cellulomonas oligotrophica]|uniref:Lipoprotein n=1 Tax=Cellulomonas oligotrophica TaxID=931536 RepID=A0A7Y9FHE8_9CELL|nr:DUF4397 domain-containing protein [Cellulomonas oligotrophica]NYD87384.1 hypothetical protein [Cellulomonas oligotrophica]GIG34528.1 lipoprotein [Cellulomonas oligotrophica]
MRARLIAGTAAGSLALAAVTLAAVPASAATDDAASLSVLHGVPDLTVDVWVNGERTLDDFEPGDLAGPLELPAGTYTVAITAADAEDDSEPAIGPVDLPLEAGMSYTAAAHLDADGEPTATLFTNDTSATAAGEGRLTVRHIAAAPAVDVLAGGTAVISGLENPDEQVLDLPAGTVSASVVAAGTTEPALLGPADVPVTEGTSTIVYAWGSASSDPASLALATQTIDGLHSSPSGVQAGQTGAAAQGTSTGTWALLAGGLAAMAALGLGVARRATVKAER